MADLCPPDREWLEWATERWLDLDADSPEAGDLLREIFRENARQWLRRDPRRLTRRAVIQRRDPETLRTLIWLRNRKMLRARGVGLRSVPAGRQMQPAPASPLTTGHLGPAERQHPAEAVRASDVFWLRSQVDLHQVADRLAPDAQAELQLPPSCGLPDFVAPKNAEATGGADEHPSLFDAPSGVAIPVKEQP